MQESYKPIVCKIWFGLFESEGVDMLSRISSDLSEYKRNGEPGTDALSNFIDDIGRETGYSRDECIHIAEKHILAMEDIRKQLTERITDDLAKFSSLTET